MRKVIIRYAACFVLLAFASPNSFAQTEAFESISESRLLVPSPVKEEIEIVDGDTIWIGVHEIRLFGIDAPEPKQPCILVGVSKSYCHSTASALLKSYAKQDGFRCEIHVRDGENKPWIRYGRYIASCYVGDLDVSRKLVAQGWAYADNNYGEIYLSEQEAAKAKRLGMHATQHMPPWDWRKSKRGERCTCD